MLYVICHIPYNHSNADVTMYLKGSHIFFLITSLLVPCEDINSHN